MSTQFDLKAIEKKAFRSTFQDGLWDMYFGLLVVGMALFLYHPPSGYSIMNDILMLLMFAVAYGLFWAGKKYITLPRMGQVRFGSLRKRKNRTLAIIMGIFVLLTAGLVAMTAFGWARPILGERLTSFINERGSTLPLVAAIGAFIVGMSMLATAHFSDFPRGYYIAMMMALAVFLMIYLNQPVYPIIIGGLIILPGLILFLRFLKTYPLQKEETSHE
jgi:hypothetical protein